MFAQTVSFASLVKGRGTAERGGGIPYYFCVLNPTHPLRSQGRKRPALSWSAPPLTRGAKERTQCTKHLSVRKGAESRLRRSLWFITTMMKTNCTKRSKYGIIKEPRRSELPQIVRTAQFGAVHFYGLAFLLCFFCAPVIGFQDSPFSFYLFCSLPCSKSPTAASTGIEKAIP